jgi:hypothetical protein
LVGGHHRQVSGATAQEKGGRPCAVGTTMREKGADAIKRRTAARRGCQTAQRRPCGPQQTNTTRGQRACPPRPPPPSSVIVPHVEHIKVLIGALEEVIEGRGAAVEERVLAVELVPGRLLDAQPGLLGIAWRWGLGDSEA